MYICMYNQLLLILSVCLQSLLSSMQSVCAIFSSMACLLRRLFPHCHKQHDYRKNVIEQNMFFDFLYKYYL